MILKLAIFPLAGELPKLTRAPVDILTSIAAKDLCEHRKTAFVYPHEREQTDMLCLTFSNERRYICVFMYISIISKVDI